jgi:hypothetical protein
MSNSPQADNVESGPRPGLPTAMIHKKILDAARNDPGASLTEISNVVSGASVELVERVLENYGDPAERHVGETPDRDADAEPTDSDAEDRSASPDTDASDSTAPSDDADTTPADPVPSAEPEPDSVTDAQHEVPDVAALTETELETLTAVAEHPQATQRELADVLGVSCATVNRRVSAVEGLCWADRQSFVESLFADRDLPASDGAATDIDENGPSTESDGTGASDDTCRSDPPLDDPELVRKVIHACLESDRISDDEELAVIGAFVDRC